MKAEENIRMMLEEISSVGDLKNKRGDNHRMSKGSDGLDRERKTVRRIWK